MIAKEKEKIINKTKQELVFKLKKIYEAEIQRIFKAESEYNQMILEESDKYSSKELGRFRKERDDLISRRTALYWAIDQLNTCLPTIEI